MGERGQPQRLTGWKAPPSLKLWRASLCHAIRKGAGRFRFAQPAPPNDPTATESGRMPDPRDYVWDGQGTRRHFLTP